MVSCHYFIQDEIEKGATEESFLGVGSFASVALSDNAHGAEIKVTPYFLEQDLLDYIIKGIISVFEKEPILIQPKILEEDIPIHKWLILGQHTSIFTVQNINVLDYVKSQTILSVSDFIKIYFNQLISKINEMKTEILIILFDFNMFKNYMTQFFIWFDKQYKENISSQIMSDHNLDTTIITELIHFLSNAFFNNKIAIIPSNPKYFPVFINTIHEIKKDCPSYSRDILFRI